MLLLTNITSTVCTPHFGRRSYPLKKWTKRKYVVNISVDTCEWKNESENKRLKKWKYMVNVSVDAPEWKIWKLSWDTRFLCPQMESIFPKRVFSSQSNLPDWCCFIFGKSKLFKLNTRIKSEACTCMKFFSLRQTLFGQAFDKEGKKTKKVDVILTNICWQD